MLSTDFSRRSYDTQAPKLFEQYGGGDWPAVVLDGGFEGALHFGDFGYGVIVIDQKGIVRDINPHDLEEAVESAFKMN